MNASRSSVSVKCCGTCLPAGPQLGGAPANFACHARALGADAAVVSRVGDDALGARSLKRFETLGLPVGLVQVDEHAATGTVGVELDALGVPRFTIHGNAAWDLLLATPFGDRRRGGCRPRTSPVTRSPWAEHKIVARMGRRHTQRDILQRLEVLGLPHLVQVDDRARRAQLRASSTRAGAQFTCRPEHGSGRYLLRDTRRFDGDEQRRRVLRQPRAAGGAGRGSIQGLVAATPASALRIFDVTCGRRSTRARS